MIGWRGLGGRGLDAVVPDQLLIGATLFRQQENTNDATVEDVTSAAEQHLYQDIVASFCTAAGSGGHLCVGQRSFHSVIDGLSVVLPLCRRMIV